jgi:hypothetical protein
MPGDQWTPSISSSGSGDSYNVHRIGITNKSSTDLRGGLPGRVGERSALPHVPGAVARSLGQRIAHCSSVSTESGARRRKDVPSLGKRVWTFPGSGQSSWPFVGWHHHSQFITNGLPLREVVVAGSLGSRGLPSRSGQPCNSRLDYGELADLTYQHVGGRDVLQAKYRQAAKDLHHPVISDSGIGCIRLQVGVSRLQTSTNTTRITVLQSGGEKKRTTTRLRVGKVRIHPRNLSQRLPFEVVGPAEELRLDGTVARNVPGVAHPARLTETVNFYV